MLIILLLLLLSISACLLCWFILDVLLTGKTPLIVTPKHAIKTLLANLELSEISVFYDLGSGTGDVLFTIAKSYPKVKCVGIDNSPFSYFIALVKNTVSRHENVSFSRQDFFKVNVSAATHVYLWLFTDALDKLLPKLSAELKPGSKVYTLDFCFSQRQPSQVLDLGKSHRFGHTLFSYTF